MLPACGHGHLLTVSERTPCASPFVPFRNPALRSLTPRLLRRSYGCHTPTNGVTLGRQARLARPLASLQVQESGEMASDATVVRPLIKMCGITSAEDAAAAARAGADYVGMIVWPKSKRSVSVSLAREIAAAARENGAEPVGVFVDESATEIESACSDANLDIAQVGSCRY